MPAPSWAAPLKSSLSGSPASCAASRKRCVSGCDLAAHVRDMNGAAMSAPRAFAGLVVLYLPEHRQEVVIAPAGIACLAPLVEILARAAHPDHGVDRARSAEQLSARPMVGIAGEAGIGLRLEIPVHGGIEEGLAVAERHLDEEAAVVPAGLQHQHGIAAARRKALGQHRSGGTRADDDEVVCLHGCLADARASRTGRTLASRRGVRPVAGAPHCVENATESGWGPR